MDTAGPKIVATERFWIFDPTLYRQSRGFGDLEADRLARLALRHGDAFLNAAGGVNIVHLQADQIATPDLAINGHAKQRKIALTVGHFQPDTNGPDMFGQQGAIQANDAALVPRRTCGEKGGKRSIALHLVPS